LRPASDTSALAAAEPALLARINQDHAEAISLCAHNLLGRAGAGWRLTGIDPDGIDLRRADETGRLEFAAALFIPEQVRAAFAGFVQAALR
jgi:putative heme iron utilization protein